MVKAVRYECSVAPMSMGNYHCRDCQRAVGTAFSTVILVPNNAIAPLILSTKITLPKPAESDALTGRDPIHLHRG